MHSNQRGLDPSKPPSPSRPQTKDQLLGATPACISGVLSHHAQRGSRRTAAALRASSQPLSAWPMLPTSHPPLCPAQGPREWALGPGCNSGEARQAHSGSERELIQGNVQMTRALAIASSSLGSAKVMEGAGGPVRNRYPDSDQAFVENLSPLTGQVEVTRSVCLF